MSALKKLMTLLALSKTKQIAHKNKKKILSQYYGSYITASKTLLFQKLTDEETERKKQKYVNLPKCFEVN